MNLISVLASVSLAHYIAVASILFSLGMLGVLLRRNTLVVLMSLEVMLNAVNLLFVAFSRYTNHIEGQVIVFFILTIAACEAAVGLAIIVSIFKQFKEVNIRFFEHMKG